MKSFAQQVEKRPDPRCLSDALAVVRRLHVNAEQCARKHKIKRLTSDLLQSVSDAAGDLCRRWFTPEHVVVVRQLAADQLAGPEMQLGERFTIPPA